MEAASVPLRIVTARLIPSLHVGCTCQHASNTQHSKRDRTALLRLGCSVFALLLTRSLLDKVSEDPKPSVYQPTGNQVPPHTTEGGGMQSIPIEPSDGPSRHPHCTSVSSSESDNSFSGFVQWK